VVAYGRVAGEPTASTAPLAVRCNGEERFARLELGSVDAPGARDWCSGVPALRGSAAADPRCTIPRWSGSPSRTWGWPTQGRASVPPAPGAAAPWSIRAGGGRRASPRGVIRADPGGPFAAWRRRCARL